MYELEFKLLVVLVLVFALASFAVASQGEVKIEEFCDFQGSYCGMFYIETLPLIEEEYGSKVELVFRHFPLGIHEYAQKAAQAAECARDQEKFREYHDTLFENQTNLDLSSLKNYAFSLGLDTDAFNSCLDSGQKEELVQSDYLEGAQRGVSGTPTFFIECEKIVGAMHPFSVFKEAIDSKLALPEPESCPVQPRPEEPPNIFESQYPNQQEEPTIGSGEILIEEYCGFSVPFCKKFFEQTYGELLELYEDKIRFEFRNFPFRELYSNDWKAAEASECALEQNKFWEMHDLLFEKQDEWAQSKNALELFDKYAAKLNLAVAQFSECVQSGKYEDEVENDYWYAKLERRVASAPSVFINGVKLEGPVVLKNIEITAGLKEYFSVRDAINENTGEVKFAVPYFSANSSIYKEIPEPSFTIINGSEKNFEITEIIAPKWVTVKPFKPKVVAPGDEAGISYSIEIEKMGLGLTTGMIKVVSPQKTLRYALEITLDDSKPIVPRYTVVGGRQDEPVYPFSGGETLVGGESIDDSSKGNYDSDDFVNIDPNFVEAEPVAQPTKIIREVQKGRFLGFIPMEFEVKKIVDKQTGEVKSIEKPWWSFLIFWEQ